MPEDTSYKEQLVAVHDDEHLAWVVLRGFLRRIVDVAKWTAFRSVALIIEQNPRSKRLVESHEIHRDSVDAVAKMIRCRAVVKDVPEMASTIRAMNLGSDHAEGSIDGCLDGTLDRIVEAGPTGAAFEFPFRFE